MLETLDAMMLCQLMLKMNIASIWGSTFILPFGLGLLASELSGSACLYLTMLGLYKHAISLHFLCWWLGFKSSSTGLQSRYYCPQQHLSSASNRRVKMSKISERNTWFSGCGLYAIHGGHGYKYRKHVLRDGLEESFCVKTNCCASVSSGTQV